MKIDFKVLTLEAHIDTDGQACWSSVIIALGLVIDLGIYAWRHL